MSRKIDGVHKYSKIESFKGGWISFLRYVCLCKKMYLINYLMICYKVWYAHLMPTFCMESFHFHYPVAFHLVCQCFGLWPNTWKTKYISISLSCMLCSCLTLLPLLALALNLSLGPSGTQHALRVNTNKQGLPSCLPPPSPARGVYVGWRDSISPLHRLHCTTLHFTNTEKTHIGNVHFKLSHSLFVLLLSVRERHQQLSVLCLEPQWL